MGLIRGQYVGLDDIGSVLWKLLEQPQTVRQLCGELGRRYRGDPDVIITDVLFYLDELRGLDLIQVVDPTANP
ncbi:PqqD family protein [Niveispirillum sp. KHB5.9]|uniref:PqqD family protein n=1 Tax=Niveispirillum sp. KHB5.9 TaxID=3400269 RepID=UPI003A87732E